MNKYENLRQQGLVVEGDYSDINSVFVRQNGDSHPLAVKPEYIADDEVTVLWPMGTDNQPSDEFDDPRLAAAKATIEGERSFESYKQSGAWTIQERKTYNPSEHLA